MTFIREGEQIPPRSLVVGNPGRVIREVLDEMITWKTKGTKLYQSLPADCNAHLKPTLPLHEIPEDRPEQEKLLETWKEISGT